MVSVTLPTVDESMTEKHPIIYTSIYPKPRYSFVWDVNTVTSYSDNMPTNENLLLKQLSAKS